VENIYILLFIGLLLNAVAIGVVALYMRKLFQILEFDYGTGVEYADEQVYEPSQQEIEAYNDYLSDLQKLDSPYRRTKVPQFDEIEFGDGIDTGVEIPEDELAYSGDSR